MTILTEVVGELEALILSDWANKVPMTVGHTRSVVISPWETDLTSPGYLGFRVGEISLREATQSGVPAFAFIDEKRQDRPEDVAAIYWAERCILQRLLANLPGWGVEEDEAARYDDELLNEIRKMYCPPESPVLEAAKTHVVRIRQALGDLDAILGDIT